MKNVKIVLSTFHALAVVRRDPEQARDQFRIMYDETADAGRTTLLSWVDRNRGAICENYNPLPGDVVGLPSFGWSAVFIIKFIDDWGVSRDVEMPAK